MSLYTEYRPTSFGELVGQETIVNNLERALAEDKVAHAYIFSGTRGTGKTTTARIVAKALGAHPLDIVEMDAASSRGIDDVRELRHGSIMAPHSDAKMYIIDECHSLTPQAWEALLKTLEEPPPRCYFILATTNLDKVPLTVRSRCQLFHFRPAARTDLVSVIKKVAKAEKIKLTGDVVDELALHARGSYRDALNHLDLLINTGDLSVDSLNSVMGVAAPEDVYQLLVDVSQGNVGEVLLATARWHEAGVDLGRVVTNLLDLLQRTLQAKYVTTEPEAERELAAMLGTDRLFELSDSLARAAEIAARSGNTRLALEAALARAAV